MIALSIFRLHCRNSCYQTVSSTRGGAVAPDRLQSTRQGNHSNIQQEHRHGCILQGNGMDRNPNFSLELWFFKGLEICVHFFWPFDGSADFEYKISFLDLCTCTIYYHWCVVFISLFSRSLGVRLWIPIYQHVSGTCVCSLKRCTIQAYVSPFDTSKSGTN